MKGKAMTRYTQNWTARRGPERQQGVWQAWEPPTL